MSLEARYDERYFDRMRGGAKLYDSFLALVPPDALVGARVLDVGCGPGALLFAMLEAGCRDLTGIDFSPTAIASARQRLSDAAKLGQRIDLRRGSIADRALLAPAVYDTAFMMDVVEHLPPDVLCAGLANVRSWLRPGGVLVIHTFPTLGTHRLFRAYLTATGRKEELDELDAIHCNVQTRASLSSALEAAGFVIDRIWLRNEFTATSSAYQRMPPGVLKSAARVLINDTLAWRPMQALLGLIGLAEFASPSIYALCRAPDVRSRH